MIRIGFYTPTVMLSADLPDVSIFTDQDFVDFRLTSGGMVLLDERYYTYNGSATVADIASLIEQYMAGNPDLNFSEFIIEASAPDGSAASHSFRVIYCDRALGLYDPSQWLL